MHILPQDASWFSIASGTVAAVSSVVTIIFSLMPVFEVNRIGKKLALVNSIVEKEDNPSRLNILILERISLEAKVIAHQICPVWKSAVSLSLSLFPWFYFMHLASDFEGAALRVLALVVVWIGGLVLIDAWGSSIFQNRVIEAFYIAGEPLPRSRVSRFDGELPKPFQLLAAEAAAAIHLSIYFCNYLLLQWRGAETLEVMGTAVMLLSLNSCMGLNIYRTLVDETEKRAALLLGARQLCG